MFAVRPRVVLSQLGDSLSEAELVGFPIEDPDNTVGGAISSSVLPCRPRAESQSKQGSFGKAPNFRTPGYWQRSSGLGAAGANAVRIFHVRKGRRVKLGGVSALVENAWGQDCQPANYGPGTEGACTLTITGDTSVSVVLKRNGPGSGQPPAPPSPCQDKRPNHGAAPGKPDPCNGERRFTPNSFKTSLAVRLLNRAVLQGARWIDEVVEDLSQLPLKFDDPGLLNIDVLLSKPSGRATSATGAAASTLIAHGSRHFYIPGRAETVPVQLTPPGRQAVANLKSGEFTFRFTFNADDGPTVSVSSTVTLHR